LQKAKTKVTIKRGSLIRLGSLFYTEPSKRSLFRASPGYSRVFAWINYYPKNKKVQCINRNGYCTKRNS
jgi:hypothetical protein